MPIKGYLSSYFGGPALKIIGAFERPAVKFGLGYAWRGPRAGPLALFRLREASVEYEPASKHQTRNAGASS